jgi:sigma-B regulation protein RsbU (phosphoserine phosphatase)
MSSLQSDTDNFIFQLIIIASIVTVVLLLFGIAFFVFRMIRPIESVSKEAERFNEDDEKKISDTLDKIKTHDEIQTLSRTLLELEIGINEYIDNLTKVTAEKERIGAELNVATQIQADMLPRIFPAFPERKEFDIHATMTPAKEVGGDFYDFFLIDEDHIGLVMADVSGKGVPAALFMVIAKTLIKNRAMMGGTPGEILGYANEQLCEGNEAELFVTVWFAIVEISTGKGMAANAGHEHPALKRKDGSYELIKYRHSPAVATMEGMRFREHEFELNPGDSLYVYTDGVTEATNSNNELFGEERVIEALNRNPGASPEELLANVKEDIDRFVAEAPQFDDITMLGFTYFGKND